MRRLDWAFSNREEKGFETDRVDSFDFDYYYYNGTGSVLLHRSIRLKASGIEAMDLLEER